MRGEPQFGSCSQEAGSRHHRLCQGNFEKATTASTKIACSDVVLVWKGMQVGEEEMEKGSWLLPHGQRIFMARMQGEMGDSDRHGHGQLLKGEGLQSSPHHPPCLLPISTSHPKLWHDLAYGFRQRQGTLLPRRSVVAAVAVDLFCACVKSSASLGWETMGGSNHVGVRMQASSVC